MFQKLILNCFADFSKLGVRGLLILDLELASNALIINFLFYINGKVYES